MSDGKDGSKEPPARGSGSNWRLHGAKTTALSRASDILLVKVAIYGVFVRPDTVVEGEATPLCPPDDSDLGGLVDSCLSTKTPVGRRELLEQDLNNVREAYVDGNLAPIATAAAPTVDNPQPDFPQMTERIR